MELSETQKQAVTQWAKEGCGLSEIQKRLQKDFGLSMTFLDVRFLVIGLGLELKEAKPSKAAQPMAPADATAPADDEETGFEEEAIGGAVKVDVDRVVKPGAVMSGSVKFSDGVTATWSLDQLGRLGLAASRRNYRPPQKDLQEFQEQLRKTLEKQGF
jgi:hypothetical protein